MKLRRDAKTELLRGVPLFSGCSKKELGLIATLAISLIGSQGLMWWFGPRSKNLPEIFGGWSVMLGDMALTADKIGNVLTSIVFVALVVLWMRSSRRGLEIRAMMMNPQLIAEHKFLDEHHGDAENEQRRAHGSSGRELRRRLGKGLVDFGRDDRDAPVRAEQQGCRELAEAKQEGDATAVEKCRSQ